MLVQNTLLFQCDRAPRLHEGVTPLSPLPRLQVRFAITADTATPTQAPYTEHLRRDGLLMSVEEYNDTQSKEFLQHVAMTIQKGDKPINFWVTERWVKPCHNA